MVHPTVHWPVCAEGFEARYRSATSQKLIQTHLKIIKCKILRYLVLAMVLKVSDGGIRNDSKEATASITSFSI
jgi:hypothetical protein